MAEPGEETDNKQRSNAEVRAQLFGVVAGIVRWVGLIIAVILVLHVILTVGGANENNGITSFVRGWANPLALGFRDLFDKIPDLKARVLVNYGLAAIFWLVVTAVVSRLIRRIGA